MPTTDICYLVNQPKIKSKVCKKDDCTGLDKLCIGYFSAESVKRLRGDNYIKDKLLKYYPFKR